MAQLRERARAEKQRLARLLKPGHIRWPSGNGIEGEGIDPHSDFVALFAFRSDKTSAWRSRPASRHMIGVGKSAEYVPKNVETVENLAKTHTVRTSI